MVKRASLACLTCIAVAFFIWPCGASGDTNESQAARVDLTHLIGLLDSGAIDRIEVFHLPNRLATTVRRSAEDVKRNYVYRLEINLRPFPQEQLSHALSATATADLPTASFDVRTVLIFHATGDQTMEISMAAPGTWKGRRVSWSVVNGHPAELSPELSLYLGSVFGRESW
jgi:hypothetical protein